LLFPRKPKGGIFSLTITDRIYTSNVSCMFFQVLGIKHFFPLRTIWYEYRWLQMCKIFLLYEMSIQ
jgi:hypothetical protein